jgi:hypothetical protein
MSYSTAESLASTAARKASSAKNTTNDQATADLAAAVENLSKAVGEIARQLKIDQ